MEDNIALWKWQKGKMYSAFGGGGGLVDVNGNPVSLVANGMKTLIELLFDIEATNEEGVIIERSTDNVTYTQLERIESVVYRYLDTTALANTLYYYRIRLFRGSVYSDYSNIASATAGAISVWDGTVGTAWDGGDGTQYNPYLISSAATLAYLASYRNAGNAVAGVYFKVTTDINLASVAWTPIGTSANYFNGIFDGDGHKIYNIAVNRNATHNGLFGYIYTSGVVKNIGIESGSIKGANYTGSITGDAYACTISNCYNKASVTAYTSGTNQFVAGIAGRLASSVALSNCFNSGAVVSAGFNVGGIAGLQSAGSVTNCYVAAAIDTTAAKQHGSILGNKTGGTCVSCFYDSTLSSVGGINYADVAGSAEGKATAAMKSNSTFTSLWDFTVWEMNANYPTLTIFDDSPNYYKAYGGLTETGTATDTFIGAMINSSMQYRSLIRGSIANRALSGRKFLVLGWADFYNEDLLMTLPLLTKYGFSSTFYSQLKLAASNPLNTVIEQETSSDKRDYRRIKDSACFLGDHSVQHWAWLTHYPLMDGVNYPSNDDFRVERSDGTNAFGFDVDATLTDSYTAIICSASYLNIAFGATAFRNLTDANCEELRTKLSFYSAIDYRYGQDMLKIYDALSALYCGTTGVSVKDDYTTRTPNTASGSYPSVGDPILGGIFQGAISLCNHEVWERIEEIFRRWYRDNAGIDVTPKFWAVPGGVTQSFCYVAISSNGYIRYYDREMTKRASGFARFTSSINGRYRSFMNVLIEKGYKASMAGYIGYGWITGDGQSRPEKRRRNFNAGVSCNDFVGDGYYDDLRILDFEAADDASLSTLLAAENVMLAKYDATKADSTSTPTTSQNNYAQVIEEICRRFSWGCFACGVEDSGVGVTNTVPRRACSALTYELLFQFCKAAGIEVISYEEAMTIAFQQVVKGENIFPNYAFSTTVKDIIGSTLCEDYPDGWNTGAMILDGTIRTFYTTATAFIRTYLIQIGTALLSLQAKGKGSIKIYRIRNKHSYWLGEYTASCKFELIATLTVNSVDYEALQYSFQIPNEGLVAYSIESEDYQNYFKGLDNKIKGLHFELIPDLGESITIKEPSLIVS